MSAAKRRILCAEAHEDVRGLIALMLERKGYEVRTAQTIAEALGLAAAERFDLYLLNDSYIDGDSFELCRSLRALDPSTPVLLFSLESSDKYRETALSMGARYYMTKTSDFAALVQTIDHLLQAG